MDKPSFCIVIPTYNRFDLLLPALLYYIGNFPTTIIYIYDNGLQRIKEKLDGIRNIRGYRKQYEPLTENIVLLGGVGKNIGVSAAWNALLTTAFSDGHTHALVLNDDIYLDRNEQSVLSLIGNPDFSNKLLTCHAESYDWSVFIMPETVFSKVGNFDENMFLYYSDNDMHIRVNKIGIDVVGLPFLNPAVFSRSSTLLKAPELSEHLEADRAYYIKKWADIPGLIT